MIDLPFSWINFCVPSSKGKRKILETTQKIVQLDKICKEFLCLQEIYVIRRHSCASDCTNAYLDIEYSAAFADEFVFHLVTWCQDHIENKNIRMAWL